MFVENLPHNLDKYGLKGIFQRVGFVSDSNIPAKLGRSRKRFGFIRYLKEVDAENSVMRLNRSMIRGCQVRVCRARYGKGNMGFKDEEVLKRKLKMGSRRTWGVKNQLGDQGMCNQKDKEVVAKMCEKKTKVSWIGLVGVLFVPRVWHGIWMTYHKLLQWLDVQRSEL